MIDSDLYRRLFQATTAAYTDSFSERFAASQAMVDAQLSGGRAIALSCADRGMAHFIAIDLDAEFPSRLAILRPILEDLGYADAAVITGGSKPDRGKVIILLRHRIPIPQAKRLLNEIMVCCYAIAEFHANGSASDHIDLRPSGGEGGLLRIGGRNKSGSIDELFDLYGGVLCVDTLKPANVRPEPKETPLSPGVKLHVQVLLERPWTWSQDDYAGVYRNTFTIAAEAYRLEGEAGEVLFKQWLLDVEANSPDLASPSPDGERRSPFDYSRHGSFAWARIWRPKRFEEIKKPKTIKYREIDSPHYNSSRKGTSIMEINKVGKVEYSPQQIRLYELLAHLSHTYGLKPHKISKDYQSLADLMGMDKGSLRKLVLDCERKGLLVVIPGEPHRVGSKGTTTTFALVGSGERFEDVKWLTTKHSCGIMSAAA